MNYYRVKTVRIRNHHYLCAAKCLCTHVLDLYNNTWMFNEIKLSFRIYDKSVRKYKLMRKYL